MKEKERERERESDGEGEGWKRDACDAPQLSQVHLKSFTCTKSNRVFKAGPLEVIFSHLWSWLLFSNFFFCFGKMENDTIFVSMHGRDHLGNRKLSKRAYRHVDELQYTETVLAKQKRKGKSTKILAQIF